MLKSGVTLYTSLGQKGISMLSMVLRLRVGLLSWKFKGLGTNDLSLDNVTHAEKVWAGARSLPNRSEVFKASLGDRHRR